MPEIPIPGPRGGHGDGGPNGRAPKATTILKVARSRVALERLGPYDRVMAEGTSSTCWTLIRGAAEGAAAAREEFALRYRRVIEAYLGARWRYSPLAHEIGDVVQDIFLECFKGGGALERVQSDSPSGFRGFLFGVARNVASRYEERKGKRTDRPVTTSVHEQLADTESEDPERVFEREWAGTLMEQAASLQANRARFLGPDAQLRIEILRLRFEEGKPVRDVAEQLAKDAAWVHRQYAEARKEFFEALKEVVTYHLPGKPADVEEECRLLLAML